MSGRRATEQQSHSPTGIMLVTGSSSAERDVVRNARPPDGVARKLERLLSRRRLLVQSVDVEIVAGSSTCWRSTTVIFGARRW